MAYYPTSEMESLGTLERKLNLWGWCEANGGYPWRVRQLDASLGTLASKAIIVEILFTYFTTLAAEP